MATDLGKEGGDVRRGNLEVNNGQKKGRRKKS
jgi:hypothetical protein